MARRPGLTIAQLQELIFDREGFRVSFERLGAERTELPPYDFPVMAPNGWTVSDWKRMRLGAYLLVFRSVTVYRGDDEPLRRDMKLGALRDTYYHARYGTLAAEGPPDNVVSIDTAPSAGAKRREH